ncbi:DUF986 family protein [Lonsdalea populi]|uniref:DUF986 family protein n=1 Tax=Lonsdalea populi TaxID=1172565 RepID=UPI000A1D9176|nr:DUF986 family protein [Lonsdalea populi]OSN00869.1 hypothetical protein AU499_09200 [Lonsdalea populi]QPQ22743.1 DUF986 domain-containing protein [Lonsdalea populi]RAT45168.1 hypothetical protein AU494_05795 [Lonsdalea populi]RAT45708.1 hypothetical protein AU495_05100 [Lonsdalea populi]RAT58533.1 hypothetical protein AU501_15280 [Lonsdalea populi]
MSFTDIVIILCIALTLIYAIYDEFIMDRCKGPTRLRILLRRRSHLDALIYIGLIGILIYKNVTSYGSTLTTVLLFSLILMVIYLSFIRYPKLLFKPQGFFHENIFIFYRRIKNIMLSEDGTLFISLEKKSLKISVRELDDLEKIYHFLIENQ